MTEIRQQLIGYLLGALESEEHEEVARQLQNDPQLRAECLRLKAALKLPACDADDHEPPLHLAERTCRLVQFFAGIEEQMRGLCTGFGECQSQSNRKVTDDTPVAKENSQLATPPAQVMCSNAPAGSAGEMVRVEQGTERSAELLVSKQLNVEDALRPKTNWWEVGVAASVLAVIGSILVPQLQQSRERSLQTACRQHLQTNFAALTRYASLHNQLLPTPSESGPLAAAGMYAPVLLEGGFLPSDRSVLCPQDQRACQEQFLLPTVVQLQSAAPRQLRVMQSQMGGSYTYALGYREAGRYLPLRLRSRAKYAIMSDVPTDRRMMASQHSRDGLNVLFEDGHCVFVYVNAESSVADCGRMSEISPAIQFFTNDAGERRAGLHADDAVLGESYVSP